MQGAGGGQELRVRVFGADARLDRMAVDAQLLLLQGQRLARGHAQLPLHQVRSGNGFGHRMLDLEPGVHLHEEEAQIAVGRRLGDELHRAGTHITHRLGCRHGRRAHLAPPCLAHAGRGGFFQHFLVASLHRAVALEQVDAVAVGVAEHLDFNVPRPRDIAFHQHRVVTKTVDGFALARGQRGVEFLRGGHHAHALAAPPGAGLDEHRVADAAGLAFEQRRVLVGTVITGHQGHAGLLHQLLGRGLQAHGLDGRGWRADEHQAGIGAGLREVFVLAQKAIAGMHGLRTRGQGRGNDAVGAQITFLGCIAADVNGFIASEHMLGLGVRVGVHGHRAHAELAGCRRNPAGDFAAIGNQNLLEHAVLRGSIAVRFAHPAI